MRTFQRRSHFRALAPDARPGQAARRKAGGGIGGRLNLHLRGGLAAALPLPLLKLPLRAAPAFLVRPFSPCLLLHLAVPLLLLALPLLYLLLLAPLLLPPT